MIRICPNGSGRLYFPARDSGTNRAVRMMAATPTGMLTQNTPRQPTESTSAPPRIGPSAIDRPNTLPHIPIARARSPGSVNVLVTIAIATGLSMDPPTACSARKAISQPSPGREAARQRAEREHGEPDLEDPAAAHPVRRRPGQHQQARDHYQVGVDRPLEPGDRRVEVPADGRHGHVDDRDVQPDDEQAQAADGQHQVPAPTAQLRQRDPSRPRPLPGANVVTLLSTTNLNRALCPPGG